MYFTRAYDLFKQAAELNHLEAGKVIGQAYFFGDIFPQNLTAAKYWFEKLANEKGSPFSQMVIDNIFIFNFIFKFYEVLKYNFLRAGFLFILFPCLQQLISIMCSYFNSCSFNI